MNIPTPILEFFRLNKEHESEQLLSLFTEDALVADGGESLQIQGKDSIRAWIEESISGLNLQTEVINGARVGEEWVVDTTVTGDFAASPARFEYFFVLEDARIQSLRVEFRGSLK